MAKKTIRDSNEQFQKNIDKRGKVPTSLSVR